MKNIKKYVGLLAGTLAVTTVVYGGRNGKSEEESSQENKKHIQKKPRLSETSSYRAIANSRFSVTPASFTPSTAQLKFDLSQLKLNLPVDMQKKHATRLLPNLRTGQVMHDGNKHYIMMPRLPETNTSQQTRTNTMSVFRPVPEHQRHLYSVISTNSQNVSTPNPTNTQAGVQYGTKPQNTLRTTQSNALQSRSFLEKAGFTISEISNSSPLELVKEYVIEYDLKVNLDRLEAFYWKCLGSIRFFAKASKTLRRPIIYFLDSRVMLFEDGMGKGSYPQNQNIIPFIAKKDNAIIVFQQASSVFYLVTPPNKQ